MPRSARRPSHGSAAEGSTPSSSTRADSLPGQVRRLRRAAERARLRVVTPTFRGRQETVGDARAACNAYRSAHPGSPCALWESSLSSALTLAQSGAADLVVVRLSSPGALHALARAPVGRILAIAPLGRKHFRAKSWRRAIKEASSSANLDLAFAPRSARQKTISSYLNVLVRSGATSPDRRAPTAPAGLKITQQTQTTLALSWKASYDSRGVVGYGVYENNVLVDSSPSTSYAFNGLSCGTVLRPRGRRIRPERKALAEDLDKAADAPVSGARASATASSLRGPTTRSPSHGSRSTTRSTGATAERRRISS